MTYKVTAEDALKQLLQQSEFPFTVTMKHGSMTIEYFAPQEIDTQTPHKQDEISLMILQPGLSSMVLKAGKADNSG